MFAVQIALLKPNGNTSTSCLFCDSRLRESNYSAKMKVDATLKSQLNDELQSRFIQKLLTLNDLEWSKHVLSHR